MVELIVMAVVAIASAYSSSKQQSRAGKTNYLISRNNALTEKQNTELSIGVQRLQNEKGYDDAKYNFQLAELNAKARERNADRLAVFADAKTKEGRTAIRRQKRSFEQFSSRQAAAIGASGIAFSGSALDVMAESYGQMALAIQDQATQINYERDANLNRANDEKFGAAMDTERARAGQASALRAYQLNEGASKLGVLSAESAFNANMFAATQQFGLAQSAAQNTMNQGYLSAAGGFASGYASSGGGSSSKSAAAPYAYARPSGGNYQSQSQRQNSAPIFRYNGIE